MRTFITFAVLLAFTGCDRKVDPACIEKSYDGRICYQVLIPVCGCNGKTYDNACTAEGYGITNYTTGECSRK